MHKVLGWLTTSEFRCLVSFRRHAQCISLIYILSLVGDREINLVFSHALLFSLVSPIVHSILPDVLMVRNPVLNTVSAAHRFADLRTRAFSDSILWLCYAHRPVYFTHILLLLVLLSAHIFNNRLVLIIA